jgi:GTP-binding protein
MPPVIAIVGRPNVGKSTLFNRLTRSRSALVDDQPGVTRDRIYGRAAEAAVTLVDTGGFDAEARDPILEQVASQVDRAVSEADAVILVVDGRQGLVPADREMAERLRHQGKRIYLAVNKIDGPELDHLAWDFYALGLEDVCAVSALHGYGIQGLLSLISSNSEEGVVPSNTEAIRVAVIGRPNVGKSSLINRLLQDDRLIVSEMPGTTRDAVDILITVGKRNYVFVDTAGIRKKARVYEKIEKFSVEKALESIKGCSIALVLIDGGEGIAEQDARICNYAAREGKGLIVAVNKFDLVEKDMSAVKRLKDEMAGQLRFASYAPTLFLSAATGKGTRKIFPLLDDLYGEISRRIPTSLVNSAIEKMLAETPPPRSGRRQLKVYFATQTGIRPPTFVLFVNSPALVTVSYERYLANRIRTDLGFPRSPVRIVIRQKA